MFDAFKAVKFDPSPLNDDAPKAPVEELNVRLALEEGDILPVACVANKGNKLYHLHYLQKLLTKQHQLNHQQMMMQLKIPVTITPVLRFLSFQNY